MKTDTTHGIVIAIIVVLTLCAGLYACPTYNVWKSKKQGEAELAQASYNRQIMVTEARAKMESASLLAESDVLRAKGTAEANKIIGASLSSPYLNWLWISNMEKQDKSVIYVPASNLGLPNQLPITEAHRLQEPEPIKTGEDN